LAVGVFCVVFIGLAGIDLWFKNWKGWVQRMDVCREKTLCTDSEQLAAEWIPDLRTDLEHREEWIVL
jgi:hypothetical protein